EIASWPGLVVSVVLVRFTWHGTDILALYAILLAASPLMLFLLAEGKWRQLLIGSWLLWLLYQVAPDRAVLPWPIQHAANFPIAAWQALFVSALTLGYQREALAHWLHDLAHPPHGRSTAFRVGVGAAVICLVLVAAALNAGHALAIGADARPLALADPFDKASLGVGRLLFFAGTASIIYGAVTLL
ncbi:MAG: OpgC domain-containing protein, partial [Catenulispora sp.]